MTTIWTPDDGALAAFTLYRNPDHGDVHADSLGHVVGRTDGAKRWVYQKGPREKQHELSYSGLSRMEFYDLRDYLMETLVGAVEGFTLEWGDNPNLLVYTEQFSVNDATGLDGWDYDQGLTVTADQALDPAGRYTSADKITFPNGGGASPRITQVLERADYADTDHIFSMWLRVPSGTENNLVMRVRDRAALSTSYGNTALALTTSWQRASCAFDPTGEAGSLSCYIEYPGGVPVGPDVNVYAWGAMVHAGTVILPYRAVKADEALTGCWMTASDLRWVEHHDVFDVTLVVSQIPT